MKKIFVLAAAMLAAAIFLMSPAGMSAAAETGAGLAFTGTLSGERAVIRNRDGAKLVLDNVMKVEEENGWLTVYVLKDVPYQVDADSFAMAIANSGDFNQVPGSRYKLYWKNADGSRGAATGETVDTAELLERGIVAIDNPTREEKHWEILPNRSSGTMTGLRGTYIVQLSDENIFSSTQRWEEAFSENRQRSGQLGDRGCGKNRPGGGGRPLGVPLQRQAPFSQGMGRGILPLHRMAADRWEMVRFLSVQRRR